MIRKPMRVAATSLRKFGTLSPYASRLDGMGESVFGEINREVVAANACNLGQGFPDIEPEPLILTALEKAARETLGLQYCPPRGNNHLVNILAEKYTDDFGFSISPKENVLVTNGGTESLFTACQTFIEPGDEAIIMEPFYDAYPAQVQLAGGISKCVSLKICGEKADDWQLDLDEVEAALSERSRLLFLNTPHNPTGKVFSKEELERLANLVKKYPRLIVVADEVYEHLVYDDAEHISIATLPGMFERVITVGSAGKTFSVTGWKCGWSIGSEENIAAMLSCHQWISFCVNTQSQRAASLCFEELLKKGQYYYGIRDTFESHRDELLESLRRADLTPTVPSGGYFILANTSNIDFPYDKDKAKDFEFTRWLIRERKLGTIPPSAFYSAKNAHLVGDYSRFAFCKSKALIKQAQKILNAGIK